MSRHTSFLDIHGPDPCVLGDYDYKKKNLGLSKNGLHPIQILISTGKMMTNRFFLWLTFFWYMDFIAQAILSNAKSGHVFCHGASSPDIFMATELRRMPLPFVLVRYTAALWNTLVS